MPSIGNRCPLNGSAVAESRRSPKIDESLLLQPTTPEQAGFVAVAQSGQWQTSTLEKGRWRRKNWGLSTSADPQHWNAAALLACRRGYWSMEAGHQRLDVSLDEDRSRVRPSKALSVLGMFRRLTVSFACAWLSRPARRRAKFTTRDFQRHLAAQNARRAFSLVTAVNPKAWNDGWTRRS